MAKLWAHPEKERGGIMVPIMVAVIAASGVWGTALFSFWAKTKDKPPCPNSVVLQPQKARDILQIRSLVRS